MKSSEILNEIKRIAKEVLPKGGQLILYMRLTRTPTGIC